MNRAWVPAGALAGLSVAGLLALGPLTDSLGTNVKFPQPVTVLNSSTPAPQSVVPVSYSAGVKGETKTKPAVNRGGRSSTVPTTNGDAGFAANRRTVVHNTTKSTPTTTETAPAKPKKPAKRVDLTATGEANGDSGLAGGSDGATLNGESSGTPAP